MKYKDQPLGKPEERLRRRQMLEDRHVEKLTRHVWRLREENRYGCDVPYFDPLDGGVDACALFLFESPGEGALASGFVSRDNRDPSAAKFAALNKEEGLKRELTSSWNTVPWALGRSPTSDDLQEAEPLLEPMLECFDHLKVVILSGTTARNRRKEVEDKGFEVLEMPHPSPNSLRFRPESEEEIR